MMTDRLLELSARLAAEKHWPVDRMDAMVRSLLDLDVPLPAVIRLVRTIPLEFLSEAVTLAARATWDIPHVQQEDALQLAVGELLTSQETGDQK
jgi:hypothetical protein